MVLRAPSFLLCSSWLPFAACVAPPPDPGVEAAIARVVDAGAAIEFHEEGEPVDAPALPGDAVLTLAAAVRRALATDPGLQSTLAQVRLALIACDQARLLPNPVLDVSFLWGDGRAQIDAGLGVALVQVLLRPQRSEAADRRLRAAATAAVGAALDLVADLQLAYATVQADDALVPLLEERQRFLQQSVDLARERARAGEAAALDATALEAQRLALDVDLAAARLERRQARLHLARLLGEPGGAAAWPLEPWVEPAEPPAEPDCITAALERRPDVTAAALLVAAFEPELAVAGWAPFSDASLGAAAQRDRRWSAGPVLALPLPVFDPGDAARRALTAEQISARHDLAAVRRRAVEEVRAARVQLEECRRSLTLVEQELLPRHEQRRDEAELAWRAGQTDLTPLLLAEDELRQARAKRLELQQRTFGASVQLQRAMGGRFAVDPSSSPEHPDHQLP